TNWQVCEIGYGMWGMGGWTGSDDEESLASLQRALDLGCNFFDTAWAYGEGRSEALLGQLVQQRFASPFAVRPGRVEKVAAQIESALQRRQRLFIIRAGP